MVQSPQKNPINRKIKRTICIGLGGTGRDILMRIRRLIVDRYGRLDGLPIVSFVHIDTDKGASQVSSLRTGNTYHGEDMLFRDAEKVITTMTSQEVDDLGRGLEKRSEYEREGPYDHIGNWFPPQLLKNIKAIEEGASGIRPVGRLAFFHNYRKIKEAIQIAENKTRGYKQSLLQKGLIVEKGLNIFVVGSLCGGTGSGMFLDIGYSLRHDYGSQENQMVGYFIIAPELYGNTPGMNANTYAALKELNHYAAEGTQFRAVYDPQHLVNVLENRPPFDYVYLIANRTSADYKIIEKSKLANVIANKIFLDFGDELAPIINGQKNNFLDKMLKNDEHPRSNVQRYLTFGLAKIYFPRDITVQVSLNYLKLQLLSFWLNGKGQSPDVQELLSRFKTTKWGLDNSRDRDIFSIKLEEATIDGNKKFVQSLNSWKNNLESDISEIKSQDDADDLINQLPRQFRQQFRKVQPGETENNRGMWLTILQQNRSQITNNFAKDIEEFLAELLNPNNPDFSLFSARAWLEAIITELNKSQRNLEEKIAGIGRISNSDDIDLRWQEAEQKIQDSRQKKGFFKKVKYVRVQEEAQNILLEIYNLIKDNFDYSLYQEALKIVTQLQELVQTLSTQASNFENLLQNLSSNYKKISGDLNHLDESEMTGEAILADSDNNNSSEGPILDGDQQSQLISVSSQITKKVGIDDSLLYFFKRDRAIDESGLQEEIDEIIAKSFGARSMNTMEPVIKRFLERYPLTQESSTRLQQIKDEAQPLLPLNLAASYYYNDPAKSMTIIGFKETENSEVKKFRNLLTRDLGIPDTILKPIQAEDEVIIVTEYAAFPLRLINGLEQMKLQYDRQYRFQGSFLHNDYNIVFTDIIPPDARKFEELQDLFYLCLAFGLIEYNENIQQYQFQFYDNLRDTYYTAELNYAWNEALEQLANLEDMAMELRRRKQEAIEEIKANPEVFQNTYYPRVKQFIKDVDNLPKYDPNYPNRATVVGTPATINNEAKEGVIFRIMRQFDAEMKIAKASSHKIKLDGKQLVAAQESEGNPVDSSVDLEDTFPEVHDAEIEDISTPREQPSSTNNNNTKALLAELRELINLKKEGLLTDEEFHNAKKQLGL